MELSQTVENTIDKYKCHPHGILDKYKYSQIPVYNQTITYSRSCKRIIELCPQKNINVIEN